MLTATPAVPNCESNSIIAIVKRVSTEYAFVAAIIIFPVRGLPITSLVIYTSISAAVSIAGMTDNISVIFAR